LKTRVLLLFITFVLFFGGTAFAGTTYTWNNSSSGNWTTSANWSPSTGYPGSSGTTDVAIINTSSITVTLTSTVTIASLSIATYGISGVTVSVSSGSVLNIPGGITTSQPTSAAVSFTFAGAGTIKIGGTITAGYSSSFAISSGATVYFMANSIFDESTNNPHGILTNNGTLNILSGCSVNLGDFSSLVNTGTIHSYGSTYTISGNGTPAAGVTNSGIFRDHSSTFNISGQNGNITNSGASANFHGSGTTITTSVSNTGINITNSNAAAVFKLDSASVVTLGQYQGALVNSGIFNAGTSNSSCVIYLNAQSTSISNTGTFYLGSTSIIYPTGVTASITNTSPGVFTLQSDAAGSAAFGPFNSTAGSLATCTGIFNVERYFQGGTTIAGGRYTERNYRIISSPVNNGLIINGNYVFGLNYIVGLTAGKTTLANSATNAFITGCTGGSTSAGNPSVYLFRESNTPSNKTFVSGNFIGITNITNSTSAGTITASDGNTYSMPVGTGVFFFFRGAATSWAARTKAPYIAPENVTLTSTGNINYGPYTYADWYSPSPANLAYTGSGTGAGTNSAVRGFNMVGNPYPCSIDWNTAYSGSGITRTNVNPTIWVFNPVTSQYDTYITKSSSTGAATGKASKIIPSGQGFFVQAAPGTPSLVITESAKSAASQVTGSNLYMGTPVQSAVQQSLSLKLSVDSLNYDDIVIGFSSTASANYNPAEDGGYIPGDGAAEGLSSLSADSVPLAINYLPLPKQTPQVIKLNVQGKLSGLYTLQRTALDAIPQIYDIWLMDDYKKDSLDIRNNTTYAFNIDLTDTNSYGKNRFRLVIRQNPALGLHLLNFTAVKSQPGAQVAWKTENEQNYTNFTVERSSDGGVTFDVLGGFVSSDLGTYSFLDKNPPVASDQYRLKLEDINGTITYSSVVTLIYGNGNNTIATNISVYPNPTNGVINLAINQSAGNTGSDNLSALQTNSLMPSLAAIPANNSQLYNIKIISITGSVVTNATSSQNTWQTSVGSLAPGTYIIQVTNSSNNAVVGKSTFVKI